MKTITTAELRSMPGGPDPNFQAMFEAASMGIGSCTLKGQIQVSNSELARMLGYSREELTRLHLRDLCSGDFESAREYFQRLRSGAMGSLKQESRFRRKDGSFFWGQLTASVVRDTQGVPRCVIAMLEDITDRKHASEKSREAEKMEVIGRLAGGVAHDFNNLLTGILLYCDLLLAGIERGSPMLQHVEEIRLAGEQGAALTQQLMAIARKQVTQPRPISLNQVVSSSENLLRRLVGEQIDLVTVLACSLRTVLADQAQMSQVLMNLVLNARDAMPQGGRITVRTRSSRARRGAPPTASLLVEDNGCGMDERTRARLFEPFFTTKPPGHGTGLGMAIIQRIVSESRGTIDVKSEPGCGTRIEVLLPAVAVVSAARQLKKRSPTGETVLLVDDHASARNSIQRVLQQAGYEVLPASSGKKAMKIFAEHPNAVDLLLADWMMPGMNGRELAEKLHHQKPGLKVLLISGYHEPGDGSPAGSVNLIRKPFAGSVLLERIREVFDSKGDSPW